MSEPQIMNYSSAADFLREYYLSRKSRSRTFSFERWAREISYSHRSNLRLIVKGERGIPTQLEKILEDSIFHSAREKKYFHLLCEIQRAKSIEKKSTLMKKAETLRAHREVVVAGSFAPEYELLASLYLLVCLGFEDVDRSATGLAALLKQSPDEVANALAKLEKMGVVQQKVPKRGKTTWTTEGHYMIFKDDHNNQRLADFHRQSFMKAIAAQRLPKNKRRFDSLILPMNPENYSEMAKEFDGFLDNLFYKYNVNQLKGKDLYHIQIATFPVL
jgi:uncharacterized protein (TIGR02147 family)